MRFQRAWLLFCLLASLVSGCATKPPRLDGVLLPQGEQAADNRPGPLVPVPTPVPEAELRLFETNKSFIGYDHVVAAEIETNWYKILDGLPSTNSVQFGRVTITFKLHADGSVTGLQIRKATVGEPFISYCQKAILEGSPYKPWPQEMRDKVQTDSHLDYRDARLVFSYEQ